MIPGAHALDEPGRRAAVRLARARRLLRYGLELRAPWEYGATLAALPLLRLAPKGDGHPVLVFPGLTASDLSTRPLRRFLRSRGYMPYGWELGRNLGPRDGVFDACRERVRAVRRRHGRRVSLIGWSLGGIYARELAKEFPDDVRLVITLGTPFSHGPRTSDAWRTYEQSTGHRIGAPDILAPLAAPPPVPTTSIYSRTDAIVPWRYSVERADATHENVEVEASHLGIGFNALAWCAIADRLAQPEGAWKPFERSGARALLFPDPLRKPRSGRLFG
ncbi:MAG: GPI inositol-deacylase [Burkholderiales bacterium]|jgi:pimeloyl-ACP methyl ester carboxylesterase|nr:GPI inositol-deacylase [Burkholderiales bacterium]